MILKPAIASAVAGFLYKCVNKKNFTQNYKKVLTSENNCSIILQV